MVNRFYLSMFVTVFIIISLGSYFSPAVAQTYAYQNLFSGSQIFFQRGCIECHSIMDVGGNIGPDLGKIKLNYSFFGIASTMWNHGPKMLPKFATKDISFPQMSSEEMDALITFLSYLNYLEQPGDPERGKKFFRDKKCIECHSVGGVGGSVGPNLDKFRRCKSPIFITTALWNHGPKMAKTMLELGIKRPDFKGYEIPDIMAFIRENAIAVDGGLEKIYALPGNPKVGETLMKEKSCMQCHSIHGVGGKIGPDLGKPDLRISFTEIAGRMWNHGPMMWQAMLNEKIPVPKFSETEMSDVLSFIYFSAIRDKRGNPLNGQFLVREKGCNNCHPIEGRGGDSNLAPDLAEKSLELELDTPTKVITEMWNHIPSMSKRVEETGLLWPTINSREMADITSYLMRLAKP